MSGGDGEAGQAERDPGWGNPGGPGWLGGGKE